MSEATRLSLETLGTRLMVDLAVALSSMTVGEVRIRGAGFTSGGQVHPVRLDYETLREIWEHTPGLISDKLRTVLETAWDLVKDLEVRG